MSTEDDAALEDTIEFLCGELDKRIKTYPATAKASKKVGLRLLILIPDLFEWVLKYYRVFTS